MGYFKQLGILSVLMSALLFANMAFAQVVGLSDPSRNGSMLGFTINLPNIQTGIASSVVIEFSGIDANEIRSLTGTEISGCNFTIIRTRSIPSPTYLICTSNKQSVRLELELTNPDAIENLAVNLAFFSSDYNTDLESVPDDNRSLNFPSVASTSSTPTVSVRVFLEGILNDE